jgi:hypothetical protein
MPQPQWQTPAGSLGTIPENIFYELPLSATVTSELVTANCTNTTAGTNVITCDTTQDARPGYSVTFAGVPFGGLEQFQTYIVLAVLGPTQFTITDDPLNTVPVTLTTASGVMTATFFQTVYYKLQAGSPPQGMQVARNGVVLGVPVPTAKIQGVPFTVSRDVTSKFTVRAWTTTQVNGVPVIDRIADRTFSITVSGDDPPLWVTPAGQIGEYYDSDFVDIQLNYTNNDPGDVALVRLVSGRIPLGLTLSSTGRIFGYVRPFPDEDDPTGYDLQPYMTAPYDFLSAAISKNYQFTLEVSDGKRNDLRTFSIFVYNRQDITADDDYITADDTFVTADETTERVPFLLNFEPSNIGTIRSENNFAYRFIGDDYDGDDIEYAISVNEGVGLPPGLKLDPYSGWYYGYIPDVGVTQNTYSFNITVRARSLVIYTTTAGTNVITCDTSTRGDFYVGAAVRFEGDVIGGLAEGVDYYVASIVSDTEFTVSETFGGPVMSLATDAVGADQLLLCVPENIPSSRAYPFSLTISGEINREVTWLTDSYLGTIINGATSLFRVEAQNVGGATLFYQLASGEFNELPQGLELLPTGEIAGRVTFNTFAIDQGETTIDANTAGIQETTFDSTFRFTVNAYAEDNQQALYKVSNLKIVNGGSGYTVAPTLTFDEPTGAGAVQAAATATINVGVVNSVTVTQPGAQYLTPATYTLSGGGGGTGAAFEVIMQQTGYRRVISSDKEFTIRVLRANKKPYQNLYIVAMPPANDRALLEELLSDQETFPPEFIYRPTDPNFGLSTQVTYLHAVGLAAQTLETYVESLDLNHYWKNLVLGEIKTAQALDTDGRVIYEVVYSEIIDDLVNAQGESVSKAVGLPYAIPDPQDPFNTIGAVFPNSLINMRDQVIDVVGQTSTVLPLWMTSKQISGRVLGFTPAWVICYTQPDRSRQIAYYIQQNFGQQLNVIDFKVDRYIIDGLLTKNWDAETQSWTPTPNLTTFDRLNTTGYTDLGTVSVCTELPFAEINGHNIQDINALGGLDGSTWISETGVTPPSGTDVVIANGSRLIFVKQENFSRIPTANLAFTHNVDWFDAEPFSYGSIPTDDGSYDYGTVIRGGYSQTCTATSSSTDLITCDSTLGMRPNDKVCFTGSVFGGIQDQTTSGATQVYYVQNVYSIQATDTDAGTSYITVSSTSGLSLGGQVWLEPWNQVTITETNSGTSKVTLQSVANLAVDEQFIPDDSIGNLVSGTTYYILTVDSGDDSITVSLTPGGVAVDPGDDSGSVTASVSGPLGGINPLDANGLARAFYIVDIVGSTVKLAQTPGGVAIGMSTQTGSSRIYLGAFAVATEPDAASPAALDTDTGEMTVRYGNDRMAIWTITIEGSKVGAVDNRVLRLTLDTQTVYNDYVASTQGEKFANGTELYVPVNPQTALSRVSWLNLLVSAVWNSTQSYPVGTVVSWQGDNYTALVNVPAGIDISNTSYWQPQVETTFDQGSVQWVEPVDMYDPTDAYDKYLVFPKQNILE